MREIKFQYIFESKLYDVKTLPPNHKVAGYVRRKVSEHPRSDKRGYVAEHRLVMEDFLGRFLEHDEVVHHKNHIRDDNRIENLEVFSDQNRHAACHAISMKRDSRAKTWEPDPNLEAQKFRLFNKNTGMMVVKNLSQLINTTFRRGQFEFRGAFTGLKDSKGVDIYEGDVLRWVINGITIEGKVYYDVESARYDLRQNNNRLICWDALRGENEVIGNIYENPNLLEDIKGAA
jgi:hypothetical protein